MQSKTDRLMCGTCEFWMGKRQPVFSTKGNPKINIIDTRGICECPLSNFEGNIRNCNARCKNFSKWTELF